MNTLADQLGLRKASDWLLFLAFAAFILTAYIFPSRLADKYPLLSANDQVYFWATIPTLIVVGGTVWFQRRRLFGREGKGWFAWLLAAGFAVPAAFWTLEIALFVNGAYDRGPAEKMSALVLRAVGDSRDRQYVLLLAGRKEPVTFVLRRGEHVVAAKGDRVTLDVMPGRLGRPWVPTHVP